MKDKEKQTIKACDLQIFGFPLIGNFTIISCGFLQMKTNGESDS